MHAIVGIGCIECHTTNEGFVFLRRKPKDCSSCQQKDYDEFYKSHISGTVRRMTKTSRYFIKTSFLCFGLGMMSGLWQYGYYVYGWTAPHTLTMAHTHIILIGGVMNMIIGVATWFFPRSKKGYKYYNPQLMWTLYWILTATTLSRFFVEILGGFKLLNAFITVGFWVSVLQLITLVFIFFQLWDRVRSKGSYIRELDGETF